MFDLGRGVTGVRALRTGSGGGGGGEYESEPNYQCSCGFKNECGTWCGNGHITGACNPPNTLQALLDVDSHFAQMKCDYERYKELYATTGDEEAFEKMLDCVYIE